MALRLHIPMHDGTLNNYGLSNVYVIDQSTAKVSSNGKLGQCYEFDGTGFMTLSDNMSEFLQNNHFSMGCWFNMFDRTNLDGNCGLISITYDRTFVITSSGTLIFRLSKESGSTSLRSKAVLNDSKWHHLFATYNNETMKIYIDGVLDSSVDVVHVSKYTNHLLIGTDVNNRYANLAVGLMNDVRIYDHCLSAREVKLLSQSLVLHYPLGNIDGKIAGKNVLLNSSGRNFYVYRGATVAFSRVEVAEYGVQDAIRAVGTIGTSNIYGTFSGVNGVDTNVNIPLDGTTYSGSIYIKNNHSSNQCRVSFNVGEAKYVEPGQTIRIEFIREWTEANANYYLQFVLSVIPGDTEFDITYWHPKIEVGDKITPWTPAPEDAPLLYDNKVYNTSGLMTNGVVTDETLPSWTTDSPRYQGCYQFDGSQYVACESPLPSGNVVSQLTVTGWAQAHEGWSDSLGVHILSGGDNFFRLALGKSCFALCSLCGEKADGTIENKTVSYGNATSVVEDTDYFVACTFDTDTAKLYLNGELVSTATFSNWTGIKCNPTDNVLYIGAYEPTSEHAIGSVSDVRMYTTALSDDDIRELYRLGATASDTGVLSTYELNEEV